MRYLTDIFSPETYEAFSRSSRAISGFRIRQQAMAKRVEVGDRFVCYMTKLSRWVGVLEVTSDAYIDETPLFYPTDDPFVVRFKVRTLFWLPKEQSLPIHDESVWNELSFTREAEGGMGWTGILRRSLNELKYEDGTTLERLISEQEQQRRVFDVDEQKYRRLVTQRIRREDKSVSVTVPTDDDDSTGNATESPEIRESASIQGILASLGEKMASKSGCPETIAPRY